MTWPVPPPGGFTSGDLDLIPGLPMHVELIDGALVFPAPQSLFHSRMLSLLSPPRFDGRGNEGLFSAQRMTVWLTERQRPEPDIMLVRFEALESPDQTWFPAEMVELVVEVVSPDSEIRDRERKPRLYAEAGIPHFWLVEREGQRGAAVYVYELDPVNRRYTNVSVHRERLRVNAPCDLDIDLAAVLHR
ncbi:Uma2 family endonuclease [Nocardiopsis arvandica]|uniref:Uma2 family endonuclease n=1 Tax=Nocardiopsis sinuspersici TaxID=501010 RepID=A0A7Z0BJB2_9ACTN|nr:Uma2 family endonuclease [Nocardiopsis sinuspersici]